MPKPNRFLSGPLPLKKIFGAEDPEVTYGLNNLGALYFNTGRFNEAEPLFCRVLAIREKTLGLEHLDVSASLNNLAGLYLSTDYAKAEPLLKRALTIRETALGPDHPDLAQSLNNLAGLYYTTDRYSEADPIVRDLTMIEKTLPPDHPHQIQFRECYADLLDQLGRTDEASELRNQAEAIRQRRERPQSPLSPDHHPPATRFAGSGRTPGTLSQTFSLPDQLGRAFGSGFLFLGKGIRW